ncbi:hypothetical protein [Rufibacter roseus]|uniref:Uncharacterized protein n=1 Tax=Rufibacter roseus TaxID=1567108 RepID=A0ABW2DTT4_9BACT|nr:hypothetical protein [Rufibacter roseus]
MSCARKDYFQKSSLVSDTASGLQGKWDSAIVVAGKHYDRGFFHRLWWGKHYRKVWATPVTLPILDLSRMHGGLSPNELGGGFQTTSLTLEDENGKKYALRSVDKNPVEVLPKGLRKSFITNLLRDQTSAAHPYGAVVVSALAMGAKIPHSHPKFVYIPKDPEGLEENKDAFSDKIFLLEEKFEGPEALTKYFGNAKDLVDSEDFLRKRFSTHGHRVNQKAFAKARLFDILIGDWDRHEGQWQWAVYDTGSVTSYSPVPKDRDQAFFKFDDGIVPWLFSRSWAPLSKMKTFKADIKSVEGYLENSEFIDSRFLNEITLEEWQQFAQELQTQLTDSVLAQAVATLPTAVYELNGPEILQKLKSRREQLPQVANKVYQYLSESALIPGTDQEDIFEVERQQNGNTLVRVYQKPAEGDAPPLLVFERLFHYKDTKIISLYGLGHEDEFKVGGRANRGIELKIYGGEGEDKLIDSSYVRGWGRKTRVYDTKRGIEVEKGKETRLKLQKGPEVHAFDRDGL